jgi:isoquinoline 1-oxidoreductase subunit beta
VSAKDLTRREVLKTAAGLQLGVFLVGTGLDRLVLRKVAADFAPLPEDGPLAEPVAMGIYLIIGADNSVTIVNPRPDMGQGPRTSLPMALAEELEVDWAQVVVQQAPADSRYGSQTSGGSTSTRNFFGPMRQAGAAAKEMLVAAAAARWAVPAATCRAEHGAVLHQATARRLTYGELAADAAKLAVPPNPALKSPADFKIIGQPTPRVNGPAMVDGSGVYGIDVRVPGLKFAVIARPHPFGGQVRSVDDAAARKVPGVRDVFRFGSGVAVIADHTWAALAGREALVIDWNPGPNAALDDAAIRERLKSGTGQLPGLPAEAVTVIQGEYDLPYLAHATMEPMNCTAHVQGDRCEVWAPTQAPGSCQSSVAGALRIPQANVTVHVTFVGGGFGRRLSTEYATEAAQLSRQVGGPVQVVWSRDDDMRHDNNYRPASHHVLRGGLDRDGKPVAWQQRAALASTGGGLVAMALDPIVNAAQPSQDRPPYAIPNTSVETARVGLPVPTGAWRSVDSTQFGFVNESFVDELAAAAKADPFELRRGLLSGRLRAVLELVAEKAGWSTPPPVGVGRGIACYTGFGSYAAHVAEVTVSPDGVVRVLRVVAAIDCGIAVNPLGIRAQLEGAISDGISTALWAAITIREGGVEQSSFDDYRWLRIDGMPLVETHIMPSTQSPGGMGEPGYPSVAPAIANAVFNLTGRRVRRLPIQTADLAGWTTGPTPTPVPATATPSRTPSPTGTPPPTQGTPSHRVYLPWVNRK